MEDFDWTLIAKYLEGTCSAQEQQLLERWRDEDEKNEKEFSAIAAAWRDARLLPPRQNMDAAWSKLSQSMNASEVTLVSAPKILSMPARSRRGRWIGPAVVAGSLLAAAAVAAIVLRGPKASTEQPIQYREYATARAQRASVQLADGTKLILAAESRLRIPSNFGVNSREVILDGEALIDVVHDVTRPFKVHTRHSVLEDVGTRFDVRAYSADSVVAVSVEDGAVALTQGSSPNTTPAVLRRGDFATLTQGHSLHVEKNTDPSINASWSTGKLVFTRTPLEDVVSTLGRWYDLNIEINDGSLAKKTVTATVIIEDTEEMLQLLAVAVGAHVERSGHSVKLSRLR